MRLPNGYGSVRKLSGNRRKPWHVQKTVAYNVDVETQKVIQKRITIGFFATHKEALQALAEYNAKPYDVSLSKITFSEVYEKWSAKKFNEVGKSSIAAYKGSYRLCGSLYDMPMASIKLLHLQNVVDNCGKNKPTLIALKVLFQQLFDYAVQHEIIEPEKNRVAYVDINSTGNPNKRPHTPFSVDEINMLWGKSDDVQVAFVLMLIYSGVRISELLNLKKEDVHLEEQYFNVKKSKTAAGVRCVPIADKVLPFWKNLYTSNDSEWLLLTSASNSKYTYDNYYKNHFKPLMVSLGMCHTAHDTRHTCISMLAAKKIEPTIIKKIVGHTGAQDLTEKIYTHLDVSVLLDAINSI